MWACSYDSNVIGRDPIGKYIQYSAVTYSEPCQTYQMERFAIGR